MKIKISIHQKMFLKMGKVVNVGNGIKYYNFRYWIKEDEKDKGNYELISLDNLPVELMDKLIKEQIILKTENT
jgi:hypothetical protein